MIKTNGFRVLAMVMTTLWMVTIIPVTVVQAADFRGQGFDLSSYNGTVNWEQVAEADMDLESAASVPRTIFLRISCIGKRLLSFK